MRHIKLITLMLIAIFSTNVADAQISKHKNEISKNTIDAKIYKKEFKKAIEMNIQVDLSNATIMGLDSADFVSWYGKNNGELTLKRFKNCVVKTVKENIDKKVFYPAKEDIPYLLKLEIEAISDDAGINAILYLIKNTGGEQKDFFHQNIKVRDGILNTFDVLLQENAEKLGKKVASKLKYGLL